MLRRTRSLLLRRGARQLSSAGDASMFTAARAFPEGLAPQRIVSLVPSWTEALFALGLGDRVVGRTEWCTQPLGLDGAVETIGGALPLRHPFDVLHAHALLLVSEYESKVSLTAPM